MALSRSLILALFCILPTLLFSQPTPKPSGFNLAKVKINGAEFHTSQTGMREKWGKEDSSSKAEIYDEMGCYAQSEGGKVTLATFYFYPGLQYVSTLGKGVHFYSLDFAHPGMSKAIITLPLLNVTAGTTQSQLLKAYPNARVMDRSTGYQFDKGEVHVALDTDNPETGEALIFEFRNGKLKQVYHWIDCA